MADMDFISAFLRQSGVEGRPQTVGYVPARPHNFTGAKRQNPRLFTAIGASGVTVATGCDLGQSSARELTACGLEPGLANRFAPWLGLKKEAAIEKLAVRPLQISEETAARLDACVHAGYLSRYVRPAYEKASHVPFDSLPREAQAVVFSVCFQKGCGGVRRDWPKLWGCLTRQDWAGASRELLTEFRQYVLRRRKEGLLLARLAPAPERQSDVCTSVL